MYKKLILFAIIAGSTLFFSCKNEKTKENAVTVNNETAVIPAEDSISAAVENKYFTKADLLTGKSITETIKTVDEEHAILYFQDLLIAFADEKLAAYNPYQEKELSVETQDTLVFEDGYSFTPETIRLKVSDNQIIDVEKYEEATFQYADDVTIEIYTDKDGLKDFTKISKEKYYSKTRYSEYDKTYEYDEKGNHIATLEKDGRKTTYLYDENSNCIKEIYADGTETSYDYKNNLLVCTHYSDFDEYYKYNDKNLCIEKYIPSYSDTWTTVEGDVITDTTPASYERKYYNNQDKLKLNWYCKEIESTVEGAQLVNNKPSVENQTAEYDENGNLIHVFQETPYDDCEYWYINDKYGNVLIKKQDIGGEGLVEKYFYEYDSNGNVLHKITEDEKEEFLKYDDNNNLVMSFTIGADYTWCKFDFYQDGRVVKTKEWRNSLKYYLNGNFVMSQDVFYKYDEHDKTVYSLSNGGYYVKYFRNEYDDESRLVKRSEYHNY